MAMPASVKAFFVRKGREGGRTRAAKLSPERRAEIASKAGQASAEAYRQKNPKPPQTETPDGSDSSPGAALGESDSDTKRAAS